MASRRSLISPAPADSQAMAPCLSHPACLSRADRRIRRIHDLVRSVRWRREGWHRLGHPLDNLGICRSIPLRDHLLNQLNRAFDLLGCHLLERIAVLDFHFPGHQQDKQFQEHRWIVLHYLVNGFRPATAESLVQLRNGLGVERLAGAIRTTARVSKLKSPPYRGVKRAVTNANASRMWRAHPGSPRIAGCGRSLARRVDRFEHYATIRS